MIPINFTVENRCPRRLEHIYSYAVSAVNAVQLCSGTGWRDIVRSLMDQAHIKSCMPSYVTCVTDMIKVNGFASVPCFESLQSFADTAVPGSDEKYIVRLRYYGYCALLPDENTGGYRLTGIRKPDWDLMKAQVDACWKYVPGTDNRTHIKRKGFRIPRIDRDHKEFEFKNVNPKENSVGDCAVRGLCGALDCTWDEAVDLLAETSGYTNPIINSCSNINNTLIRLKFDRHKTIRKNGRMLTGKEFCDLMTYTYHRGEHIFAYVGRSHCAAILPFTGPGGEIRYKTQDTWDSTNKKIGDYWVIPANYKLESLKKEPARQEGKNTAFTPGGSVTHPRFGRGTILEEKDGVLTVEFEKAGIKRLLKEFFQNTD